MSSYRLKACIVSSGSASVGLGHLYRQHELSRTLSARGLSVHIIGIIPSDLEYMFRSIGTQVFPTAHEPSASEILAHLDKHCFDPRRDWVIQDNYNLQTDFASKITAHYSNLVLFEDHEVAHGDYRILVNPGFSKTRLSVSEVAPLGHARFLAESGAIIRDTIRQHRLSSGRSNRPRNTLHALISFGASDPTDHSSRVLDYLRANRTGVSFDVLLGPSYLGQLAPGQIESNVRAIKLEKPITREYFDYDFAIGAGGISAYERAFCGLPSINFVLFRNQLGVATTIAELGAAFSIRESQIDCLGPLIKKLSDDEVRKVMSLNGESKLDGLAAERVADKMVAQSCPE